MIVHSALDSDEQSHQAVTEAMRVIGFSPEEVESVHRILAAILHLGNIEFVETEEGGLQKEGLAVAEETLVDHVAELTATPRDLVLRSLLARTVASGGRELIEKGHTAAEASYARDACAKAVYQRLFEWVVNRINSVMEPRGRDPRRDGKDTVIGVLDIYGFEVFPVNSFEQFCINYCNEKLQQLFIRLILKQEQEEYEREGIAWQSVEYFNNATIVDLVERPHRGILAVLDEACSSAGTITDRIFLQTLDTHHRHHLHYTSRQVPPAVPAPPQWAGGTCPTGTTLPIPRGDWVGTQLWCHCCHCGDLLCPGGGEAGLSPHTDLPHTFCALTSACPHSSAPQTRPWSLAETSGSSIMQGMSRKGPSPAHPWPSHRHHGMCHGAGVLQESGWETGVMAPSATPTPLRH